MQSQFSCVTKTYLDTFCHILEHMIQCMDEADMTESISHNFIVQMIPHHEAAIEMSQNILRYTTDLSLERIAKCIIAEQTKSIADMRRILPACSECCNSEQDLRRYQCEIDKIKQTMFAQMKCAQRTNCINCNFIREMIPHHEGAVKMGTCVLQCPICSGLKPIVQNIISSQKRGIAQMQHLFQCLGC